MERHEQTREENLLRHYLHPDRSFDLDFHFSLNLPFIVINYERDTKSRQADASEEREARQIHFHAALSAGI